MLALGRDWMAASSAAPAGDQARHQGSVRPWKGPRADRRRLWLHKHTDRSEKEKRTQVEVYKVFRLVCDVRACTQDRCQRQPERRERKQLAGLGRKGLCESVPKFRPTMQCQVGLYFLSNSFLMKAAMSFSMLYFSSACTPPLPGQIQRAMFPL